MDAGAEFADEDCGGGLEEDVGDEEDEGDDRVAGDGAGGGPGFREGKLCVHAGEASDGSFREVERYAIAYPATAAADKLVRSIRLMQYSTPTVTTRRRSMR